LYDFIKFDESAVLEEAIVKYEEATNTMLFAGDERRILLNSFMYIAAVIAAKGNYLANQYFAQTAVLPYLRYIGEGRSVFQLGAGKSLVTMRFSVPSAKAFDIEVPSGTRVTPDGTHFFATKVNYTLMQGTLSIDIPCEATVPGKAHDGFTPGSINTLVDNIPYISNVTNIDTSSGGSEVEDIEDYRERIMLKPYGYNTAGAEAAYIYLVKTADSSIGSVTVKNEPSSLLITILHKDGTIPSDLVVQRVSDALNAKTVRPLADQVTVQKPTIVPYSISLSYTISEDDAPNMVEINSKIIAAVSEYVAYQGTEIGRSINPDLLKKFVLNAGAYTVNITSPVFTEVNKQSVAQINGNPVITYDGIYQEAL
jgi:phage-related baseplate assembly protein